MADDRRLQVTVFADRFVQARHHSRDPALKKIVLMHRLRELAPRPDDGQIAESVYHDLISQRYPVVTMLHIGYHFISRDQKEFIRDRTPSVSAAFSGLGADYYRLCRF